MQKLLWHSYSRNNLLINFNAYILFSLNCRRQFSLQNVINKPACCFSTALFKIQYKGHQTRESEQFAQLKSQIFLGSMFTMWKNNYSFCGDSKKSEYNMSFNRVLSKWEGLLLNSLKYREEQEEQRSYLWDETCRWMCACIRTQQSALFPDSRVMACNYFFNGRPCVYQNVNVCIITGSTTAARMSRQLARQSSLKIEWQISMHCCHAKWQTEYPHRP